VPNPIGGPTHPDVASAVSAMAETLRSLGHDVTERAANYGRIGDAITPLWLNGIAVDVADVPHPERLSRRTRGFGRLGGRLASLAAKAKEAEPVHAARINSMFDSCDVYLTATTAQPPVEVGRWEGRSALRTALGMARVYPYTPPWNVLGNPAAAVPAGFTNDGLPLSVQIVGREGDEATLLSLAAQIEAERHWADPRPPIS
jgi:amidase